MNMCGEHTQNICFYVRFSEKKNERMIVLAMAGAQNPNAILPFANFHCEMNEMANGKRDLSDEFCTSIYVSALILWLEPIILSLFLE